MRKQSMKDMLHNALWQSPPPGAAERCLNALPQVTPRSRLAPLLRLQLRSLPWYLYAAAAAALLAISALNRWEQRESAVFYSSLLLSGVGLLLLWHMVFSQSHDMSELERTCRYSYSQLLLSRWLCFGALLLALCAGIGLSVSLLARATLQSILIMLLPVTVCCAATLGLMTLIPAENDYAAITVYLLSGVICAFLTRRLSAGSVWTVAAVLSASVILTVWESKALITRRIYHEPFSL